MKRTLIFAFSMLFGIATQAQIMKSADLEKYAKERYGDKWLDAAKNLAGTLKLDKNESLTYQQVIEAPGKTKQQLYVALNYWATATFKDKNAITLNDKDAGCIIISSPIDGIADHTGTLNRYIVSITPVTQDRDNYIWIRDAKANKLVVGTQARILYQDAEGRTRIALKFNEMVRSGEIGPVMIGRDHHDVSGTDSPFRETANIKDGSNVMADMAVQCFAGNAARGMSLCALHNGGGVGIGKSINGGFGLVLDGSERVDAIIRSAMMWDVMGGVARRNWARNEHSVETSIKYNEKWAGKAHITIPYFADDELITKTVAERMDK